MKRALVVLASLLPLTGCIVYSPSPSTSSLGYTFDYPVSTGGAVAPATASGSFSEPAVVHPAYLSERIPLPPRVPPVYSEIPEPLPRIAQPVTQTTRTYIYPGGQAGFREPAGATQVEATQQPTAVPAAAPGPVIYNAGPPIILGDLGTNVTNNVSTNQTNNLSGSLTNTNNFSQTNMNQTNFAGGTITNTNAFGIVPATNINEAAGAQRTNPFAPQGTLNGFTNPPPASPPLNEPAGAPAPRLPAQPRIPSFDTNSQTGTTVFPGPGGTASPNAPAQQQQQQQTAPQQTVPPVQQNPAPFTPVAPPR